MKSKTLVFLTILSSMLLFRLDCNAEKWVKTSMKSKLVKAAFLDDDSVKVQGKTINWTYKIILNSAGSKANTKDLSNYAACRQNILKKGNVEYWMEDFQIENGNYRSVAARYYNSKNELLCTEKEKGDSYDKSWSPIPPVSPVAENYRYFLKKLKRDDI